MSVNQLQRWSDRTGLRFSEQKTVSMHICRKRGCPKLANEFKLNNTEIECKTQYKYLGLVIDNSLTWRNHIINLKGECVKRLNLLKHLSHTAWGADSASLTRLYKALILTKIDYGCEAYGSACKSLLKTLEPVQNQAMRIATGAFRSTPIQSLQILSGLFPCAMHREYRKLQYVIRIIVNPNNPLMGLSLML